jgi:hypothetical protein
MGVVTHKWTRLWSGNDTQWKTDVAGCSLMVAALIAALIVGEGHVR